MKSAALMLDRAESLADVSLSRREGIARELQCDIPSAEPGELLDPHNYVLQRLIGSGGVSKVYAATQRSTGQLCCVKVLRREFRHKSPDAAPVCCRIPCHPKTGSRKYRGNARNGPIAGWGSFFGHGLDRGGQSTKTVAGGPLATN